MSATPPGSPRNRSASAGGRTGEQQSSAEGRCFCGAVRYRIPLPPLWVAHCHCSMCRRAHGAGFVTWAGTRDEHFELLASETLQRFESSPGATRSFCGRCGSPLFFESKHWPGEVHVTLASLDPAVAEMLTPQVHAYWSSRVPWVVVGDDGLPRKDPPEHGG